MAEAEEEAKNKGGRPKLIETPEFKEAVGAAVEAALAPLMAKLTAARTDAGTHEDNSDRSFMRLLAMEIANLSDQGTNRKRVSPEEMARREEAKDRMLDLIVKARASGAKPVYRVMTEIYFGERKILPYRTDSQTKQAVPQLIDWSGIPNTALMPMDDTAKAIYAEFLVWSDGAPKVDHQSGKGVHAIDSNMWVTLGGLVVRGGSGQRRMVGNMGDPIAPEESQGSVAPQFEDEVSILGPNDPRAKEVRVLGTVAAPARQTSVPEMAH